MIVNISAIVAEMPTAGMAAYSASKAALTAFDRAGGRELRREGIRVVDVRPPHLDTGLENRPIAGEPPRLPQGQDRRRRGPGGSPTPSTTPPAPRSAPGRDQVHRLQARARPAARGAGARLPIASVCDLFAGTTRVGQAFRRAGLPRRLERPGQLLRGVRPGVHRRRRRPRPRPPAARCSPSCRRCPARPGYVTETFCEQARFFSPDNGARIDAIRAAHRRARRRPGHARLPADQPARGGRPRRLDLRAADGLPQAAGRRAACARSSCASPSRSRARAGDGGAARRPTTWRASSTASTAPTSTRPTTSTPTSRTTTCGRRSPAATGPRPTASRASGSTAAPRAAPSTARATPGPRWST